MSLASVATQTLPPACYEILVVDNASTDDTQAVVVREFGHVPDP